MFDEDGNIEVLDFNLCIKCQEPTPEPLVNNPSSLNKLLTSIEECSKYGDGPSVIRKRQIEQFKLRFLRRHHSTLVVTRTLHIRKLQIPLRKNIFNDNRMQVYLIMNHRPVRVLNILQGL